MTAPQNNITERVSTCTNNIINCHNITSDGITVIIEAYKKDLQDLLRKEKRIDNVMIQSTQNYFWEIGSNLDKNITTHQVILAAIEKLRVAFRETTKTHNSNYINTPESIQINTDFPESIEQQTESIEQQTESIEQPREEESESKTLQIPLTIKPKIKKSRKKSIQVSEEKIVQTEENNSSKEVSPKNPEPAFVLPESYRTKSIFGSKTTPKNKIKSDKESLFDIKMRTLSPNQSSKSTQNSSNTIDNPLTPLTLTKEEKEQIQTIYNAELPKEIKIRSIISKLDEVRAIQKNYETVIMNYTEIMSIIINQNQTVKTEMQMEYIEKSRNILYELRNYINNTKNSLFVFKSSEQKNNSYEKINKVSKHIKLLVQFN